MRTGAAHSIKPSAVVHLQSEPTDRAARWGPRVPGDLKFSLVALGAPCFSSEIFLGLTKNSDDLISRPDDKVHAVQAARDIDALGTHMHTFTHVYALPTVCI